MRPGFVLPACILPAFSPINEPDVISPLSGGLNSPSIPPFNGSKEVVTMFAMNANYGSIILSVS